MSVCVGCPHCVCDPTDYEDWCQVCPDCEARGF